MPTIETRILSAATNLRAQGQGDEMSLVGYAARFNSPSKSMTDKSGIQFVETIAPGAFTRALADGSDVCCLFNHDPNRVLGRTKSGTLKLTQDDKGLSFRCQLDPRQQEHRALHAAVDRGDISSCSFAFAPNGADGDDWQDDGRQIVRTLKDVKLFDCSLVTHPAYNDTSVSAREAIITPEVRSIVAGLLAKRSRPVAIVRPIAQKGLTVSERRAQHAEVRRLMEKYPELSLEHVQRCIRLAYDEDTMLQLRAAAIAERIRTGRA